MAAKVYKFLIYVSIIAVLAVVIGQVLWTNYSHKVIRQAGYTLIHLSLSKASNDFNILIRQKQEMGEEKPAFAELREMIDSVLSKEFRSVALLENLNYGIYRENEILYKTSDEVSDEDILNSDFRRGFYYEKYKPALMVSVVPPTSLGYYMSLSHMSFWWLISMFGFTVIGLVAVILLRSMRKYREEANLRVKTINNIAHEFKTPLASIKLAGEMLLNKDVAKQPDRVHRYAELIEYEVKRLQLQTEQFQNVVLLEEGQIMLRFSYVHVNEVLSKMAGHFLLVRADFQDRLLTDLRAENDIIYADPAHFENVISNLIDNAFKYGGEKVVVKLITRSNSDCIIISVEDNGAGISKPQQKLIFDRFYRVTPVNKHDIKGHGIGLYYVKTILKQMGAEIFVSSRPNKGARFEIQFPAETNNLQK